MKKYIKVLFLIMFALFISFPALAEEISNYEVDITINTDSTINVQEKIFYNFGENQKHGIYRDIPFKYSDRGGIFTVEISNVSVVDENGNSYKFSTSKVNNDFKIKIGDADLFVSGQKTYVINYKVRKEINYFTDYDELYWNAIGGNNLVDINKSSVKIHVPENNNTKYACYYGELGSKIDCPVIKEGNTLSIEHNQVLPPGNYLTIVVGLPKGILYQPSTLEVIRDKALDNAVLFVPVLVFIFLFIKWYREGRDPKGRGVIIPQYGPVKNLSPLESATLINERYDVRNISAEMIYLAIKGYLKIEKVEDKKDYLLIKTKEADESLEEFQKTLLSDIFKKNETVLLSKIEDAHLESMVQESITGKGYFLVNPKKVQAPYIIIGSILLFLSIIIGSVFGVIGTLSIIFTGIMIIIFGIIMPKKTLNGVYAKEYLLGLKKYIALAEIRRIQFHNAPEKNIEHFEALLPFAMIFGLEKKWAEQFKSLTYSPTWYSDKNFNIFVPVAFADNLESFSSVGVASMTVASSGGSGFSGGGGGGGFGGGGSGSW
ncbi:MAG: DUF2207 domain-containing protein [Candidatus Paceibacterota bacterium]|jgi:uncharacterized membrane protein YgcG